MFLILISLSLPLSLSLSLSLSLKSINLSSSEDLKKDQKVQETQKWHYKVELKASERLEHQDFYF